MNDLKWNGKEIISFLNIFQNYPCLWDVTEEDYLNRNIKEVSYNKLLEDLKTAGIPGTLESIKKKIKSLRDTYRKELNKVQKSKKSGSGANDVYKPKLVWFSAAEIFWHGSVTSRESSSNLDLQQRSTPKGGTDSLNDAEHESDTEHTSEDVASQVEKPESQRFLEPSQSASTTPTRKRPSSQMLPPQRAKLLKWLPRRKQLPSRFETTVNKLQQIAELTTPDPEDQYDKFAKHLASQLRELPLRSFILLQSKIQNLVTEERLTNLNASNIAPLSQGVDMSRQNSTSYQNFGTIYNESDNSYSESSDTCFNEDQSPDGMDILNQALSSICKDSKIMEL